MKHGYRRYNLFVANSIIPTAGKGLFNGKYPRRAGVKIAYVGDPTRHALPDDVKIIEGHDAIKASKSPYLLDCTPDAYLGVPERELAIDATDEWSGAGRWINDTHGPPDKHGVRHIGRPNIEYNCRFIRQAMHARDRTVPEIEVIRDIKPHEEFYIEYGDDYWKDRKFHGFGKPYAPPRIDLTLDDSDDDVQVVLEPAPPLIVPRQGPLVLQLPPPPPAPFRQVVVGWRKFPYQQRLTSAMHAHKLSERKKRIEATLTTDAEAWYNQGKRFNTLHLPLMAKAAKRPRLQRWRPGSAQR
jgi:hypothetical protein